MSETQWRFEYLDIVIYHITYNYYPEYIYKNINIISNKNLQELTLEEIKFNMKNRISSLITLVVLIGSAVYILPQCYERIPAGFAGIRENLYGSDKGVDDVTEVSGMVWFNPLLTRIHKFPKYNSRMPKGI